MSPEALPPPALHALPAPSAASAAAPASSPSAPRTRRVAGPEQLVRSGVSVTEDAHNRIEVTRNAKGEVTRILVQPKNGSRSYEVQPSDGQRLWRLGTF